MDLIDRPMTAIERARTAYERMMQHQRAIAEERRGRERARTIRMIGAGVLVLAILLGTAAYNGWLPASLFAFGGDDAGQFGTTRTGQVRSFVAGNTCQELQFNNERGVYVRGNLVPCQAVKLEASPPAKGARMNSIRDAFTSR